MAEEESSKIGIAEKAGLAPLDWIAPREYR